MSTPAIKDSLTPAPEPSAGAGPNCDAVGPLETLPGRTPPELERANAMLRQACNERDDEIARLRSVLKVIRDYYGGSGYIGAMAADALSGQNTQCSQLGNKGPQIPMTPLDSPARQPSWLARMVGPLLFAPGQQPDSVALVLVDTLAELRETVTTWGGREADDDMEACCCFDYDAPGREYGFVIFARERLTRALLVHECTHAALAFVGAEVMTSEAVKAMSEDEQAEYYDEACARVCEHLFEQAERLLWPCPASVKGIPTERETGASAEGNDAGSRGAVASWSNGKAD